MAKNRDQESHSLPPNQVPRRQILRWGKDHPTISGPVPKIDLSKWLLVVEGEVNRPLRLSWDDYLKLPKVESISDFHCVEGWSVLDCRWEGVTFKHMMEVAGAKESAKFVSFECADGYTTSLSLENLLGEDVLLAYKLDGKNLEAELGGPLRLVVPSKYAYKSAMWIRKIKFTSNKEIGFWERRGYSDSADVWKNDRFNI